MGAFLGFHTIYFRVHWNGCSCGNAWMGRRPDASGMFGAGYGQGRYYAGNAGRVTGRIPGRSPGTDQKGICRKRPLSSQPLFPRLWGFSHFSAKKGARMDAGAKADRSFGHGKLHAFPHQIRYRIYRFFSPERKMCGKKQMSGM